MSNSINRRDFISGAAIMGAAGMLGASCNGGNREPAMTPLRPLSEWNIPKLYEGGVLPDKADDGRELRVGLIGCGGQGTGTLRNLLNAANGITVAALGDTFQDRLERCRNMLRETFNVEVPDNMCFIGFDNYLKVIDAGVDIVLIVTPPAFRPMQFRAAVAAGKHCFLEKPLCVDPVGARSILTSARQADAQGLCVVTGTQRHHQRSYVDGYKQVQSGMIGEIVGGQVYWNQQQLWHAAKQANQTDLEWMIRDWVNWNWLSGDHIVEQHIHNIDVFNWFSHSKPVSATGFGARHRRVTGDQYDMFSIDFVYEGGIHVHSMCRQINGTTGSVMERIQGTKGVWTSNGVITDLQGNELWRFDAEQEREEFEQTNPFVLELVNWVNHIRKGVHINQAEETTISSLAAIMGRQSAYTGLQVSWDETYNSDMNLLPNSLEFRNLDWQTLYPVPVPGTEQPQRAQRG
jgi:predicted dehydrogenase